jgi:Mrp family chromosome partitioning ATPase
MPPAAAGQLRELANLLAHTVQERGTVALISPTEGDGRTTAAINLAAELARRGRSVALVLLAAELEGDVRAEMRTAKVDLIDVGAAPIAKTVAKVRLQADLVLIDGPALERGGDLIALLEPAEFILVTRAGHTPRRAAADARDLLCAMAIAPRGVVFMGARRADVRRRGSRLGEPRDTPETIVARADDLTKPWDARVSS